MLSGLAARWLALSCAGDCWLLLSGSDGWRCSRCGGGGACSRLAVLRLVVVGFWLFDVSRCGLLLAGSGCWYFLARGSCWRLMVGRGSGVWWGGWHYPAWAGLQGWAHGCCSMFPGVLDSVAVAGRSSAWRWRACYPGTGGGFCQTRCVAF